MNTWSFWLTLAVCIASLIRAWDDHGKTFAEYRNANGSARQRALLKFVLLWSLPVVSLFATVSRAWEAKANASQMHELRSSASNALSRAALAVEQQKRRLLSKLMRDRLVQALGPIPKAGVSLNCQVGDAEANDFMSELSSAFTEAGFGSVNMALLPGVFPPGLVMENPKFQPPASDWTHF